MTNVINFAAFKNARRAAEEITRRAEATAQRVANEKASLTEKLGGTIGAAIVADVAVDLQEKEKAAKHTFMPAYCDPENEVRGAKHDATRNLSLAEIAKRMRADVKALGLAKGIKISVRTRTYSGGGSIDMEVTALPEGFRVMTDAAASWKKQFGEAKNYPGYWKDMQSDELNALIAKLEGVHNAYNRDNSDSMVDYFDRRYYGSVSLDWQVRRDREAAEIEASAGTYWAE